MGLGYYFTSGRSVQLYVRIAMLFSNSVEKSAYFRRFNI